MKDVITDYLNASYKCISGCLVFIYVLYTVFNYDVIVFPFLY